MNVFYDPGYFPQSPEDSGDFPWNSQVETLPDNMPNGNAWPKITVVTPSYNQGEYIEETIRSVLLQGYPNLEYIIMDGGSTDQTVEIIKKYETWIDYWESEPDRGQSHAINKGFQRSTGDLTIWINSDDVLLPNALRCAALACVPKASMIILGGVINFFENSTREILVEQSGIQLKNFIGEPEKEFSWNQPGTFVSKECLKYAKELDESLHYAFDWDWMCRLLIQKPKIHYLADPIARFRVHDESKTGGNMPACWQETIMA